MGKKEANYELIEGDGPIFGGEQNGTCNLCGNTDAHPVISKGEHGLHVSDGYHTGWLCFRCLVLVEKDTGTTVWTRRTKHGNAISFLCHGRDTGWAKILHDDLTREKSHEVTEMFGTLVETERDKPTATPGKRKPASRKQEKTEQKERSRGSSRKHARKKPWQR